MKTKILVLFIVAMVMAALVSSGSVQQSANQLYQSGIYKEDVEGKLEEAIAMYQEIIVKFPQEGPVAAKALFRMGLCYEKLGREGAQKTYQKLITDYPGQTQEVTAARQRLAALSKISDADRKPVFTTRQILAGPMLGVGSYALSPDGRYLSFENQTGDLAVRDLKTGEIRRLTNESFLGGDVSMHRWSPDGKYIAYVWDGQKADLRVISAEGGKSRVLVEGEEYVWMKVFDWSFDSKKILATLYKKASGQIALVSAADGAITVLKTFEYSEFSFAPGSDWPAVICFSPDGQYVAYDNPQEKFVREHDIFVISTDGKREFPLVQHPADDRLLGWPPKGKSILFVSDRAGSWNMWIQEVSVGKAQGLPALVKRGLDRIEPLGFAQSGAFYYRLGGPQGLDIYSARIDFPSGKVLAPPEVIIKNHKGSNSYPDYSADGKYLAYLTTSPSGNLQDSVLNILCIRSLESGKEREFTTRFKDLSGTQWSPDGQFLYLTALGDQGSGIYRVNAKTGEFTLIVPNNLPLSNPNLNIHITRHRVTPDGKTIIYRRLVDDWAFFRIIARNLITGEEKPLYSGMYPSFSISPDGQWLALLVWGQQKKVLRVFSLNGGWVKDLLQFEENPYFMPADIEWTADGKYILFQRPVRTKEDVIQFRMWRIAADGGEPQELNLPMGAFQGLSAHPDGQHLVFGSSKSELNTTAGIWVMENFLPPAASASK